MFFLYRAPEPGSWVVDTKGRGFLMALCAGEGREVGHKACHKPKMGIWEKFFWEGLQCASCQPKETCSSEQGGTAVQSKQVLAWLWGSFRWSSVVVQPSRTRECSRLSICTCQALAKNSPRGPALVFTLILPDKEEEMWRSGIKLCLKEDNYCQWISVFF